MSSETVSGGLSDKTQRALDEIGDDAAVLLAMLCNTPTLGSYRIQEHCHNRVADLVEEGRKLGSLNAQKCVPLERDVKLACTTLRDSVEEGRCALQRMHCLIGRMVAAQRNVPPSSSMES